MGISITSIKFHSFSVPWIDVGPITPKTIFPLANKLATSLRHQKPPGFGSLDTMSSKDTNLS